MTDTCRVRHKRIFQSSGGQESVHVHSLQHNIATLNETEVFCAFKYHQKVEMSARQLYQHSKIGCLDERASANFDHCCNSE